MTQEEDELIICLGIGQRCFLEGSRSARIIEQELIPAKFAYCEAGDPSLGGRRCYALTDAGINHFKKLEMLNGRQFDR